MDAKEVTVFKCPRCEERFLDEADALGCCGGTPEGTAFQCGACGELWDDEESAESCCADKNGGVGESNDGK